jgi:hypothetical protein
MDILPIQASAIPCKQVFSSGKMTMVPRRNHINMDLMEALQILKFSIRQDINLSFTDRFHWDEEVAELEALERMQE